MNKTLIMIENFDPKPVARYGTALFVVCVALSYTLYPHWTTLSGFTGRWYTLIPYVLALLIAMFELIYFGNSIHRQTQSEIGAIALFASALSVGLVLCIPYTGSPAQKDLHDLFALLFAVCAAFGFAIIAKQLKNITLGVLAGVIFVICVLEVVFLARYREHPVRPWTWTILEMTAIAALIAALNIVAAILGQKRKASVPN